MSVTESARAGQPANEPEEPAPSGPPSDKAAATVTPIHVIGLGIVVLGILAVVGLVMPKFNAERDTAAGVLGIVIPAFATIGAALFGITIAYSEGKSTGEEKGKAKGETAKAKAVATAGSAGRKSAASEILARLQPSDEASDRVVTAIGEALVSPAGERRYVLDPHQVGDQRLTIDAVDLENTRAGIREAIRRCNEILEAEAPITTS